ncbi:LysR family transcriptional regulator [Cupriavidus pauculus]|uniref:LysR family transcriptional regulator n=1 Tax=Cupriavidus pauculus TaxID=82633 RepID=UPI001FD616D0|nr:LysR family transcriptional regulator [Cupriavidus pauculus]
MDNISTFNLFVQVAETRSFVATGRLLGVSASAVGKSIVRLESRLGVRLFNRNTRSVTLTEEGALFLDRCRRILAEIAAAEEELTQTAVAPRGRLRVSLPVVGEPFLSVLARFKKTYPSVDLDLDFSDRKVDVIDEGFDAVIRSGDSDDSRLTARRVGGYRMLLVGAPTYFEERGVPKLPRDLTNHACIQFRFPNTGKLQPWPLERNGSDPDFSLPTSVVCNNFEARICFALEGLGIAYLPDFAIRDLLASGRLVAVMGDYTESSVYRIMWPSGKNPAPKLRVFIDYLVENLFPHQRGEDIVQSA